MDGIQALICETLEIQEHFNQSWILKSPYKEVTPEHVQLLHDGNNHWFLSFCSNGRVQICDGFNSALTQTSIKFIQVLYRNFSRDSAKVMVAFLPVQKQQDGRNCVLFAMVFAAKILDGKLPIDAVFHDPQLRNHLIYYLHCVKSVQIRSVFWSVFCCIHAVLSPNTGKSGPEKTLYLGTFHAMLESGALTPCPKIWIENVNKATELLY